MSKKQDILNLYYEQNINIAKIVDEVQVSRPYITKVIKSDERYMLKKEKQKGETRQRKKAYTKRKMQKTREIKYHENAMLKQQHIQQLKNYQVETLLLVIELLENGILQYIDIILKAKHIIL